MVVTQYRVFHDGVRRTAMALTALRSRAMQGLTAIALLTLIGPAGAAAALPATVTAALKAAAVPAAAIGIVVIEPGGRTLLAHRESEPMNPASVMKLVTTTVALELLGPAYTWRTEVHLAGKLQNERLDGDLILRGGGDPHLTMESLWMLLRDVRARGVREITGDLVLDRSLFATGPFDPAAFDGEPARPYNVGPDALLLNFKAFRLTFIPDATASTVRILAEPPLAGVRIVNNLVVGNGACGEWPEKPDVDLPNATLSFNGNYAASCGEKVKHFSLLTPDDYARALFEQLWRQLGGTFSGKVREGTVPPGSIPLTGIDSPSLLEVVRDINKNSNNVMARQLYLALAAGRHTPGSPDTSRAVVASWFERRGIVAPEVVMENGAGLSRFERIAPTTLARLLELAWLGPFGPELASSLPIAGIDGTMKRRFATGSAVVGRAHLKSGFLDNVRAVAGYVHGENGRTLIVVSVINHANARAAAAVQEAVVEWAYGEASRGRCCGRQ